MQLPAGAYPVMSVENFTCRADQYKMRDEGNCVCTIPNGIEAPGLFMFSS